MRKGTCVHFTGLLQNTCKAGHNYVEIASPLTETDIAWHNENYPGTPMEKTGIALRLPCHSENNVHTCPDYREPTQTEIDQQEAEFGEILRRVIVTRETIVKYLKEINAPRGISGTIPCPICGVGQVSFSRAAYNGHIHAQCSTPECVFWIE